MTSENGSRAMSLQTESPDSEVASWDSSAQPTSGDIPQSTTTTPNECFYSDTSPDSWPMNSVANSSSTLYNSGSSGFFPGSPTGSAGSMLDPNLQHQHPPFRQFSQMVIPTFHGSQIPPTHASPSGSNGCHQMPSKVHKRHVSNSGRRCAQEKSSKTALRSDQIVETSGFGVPHRRGGRDLDRMGGNEGTCVVQCTKHSVSPLLWAVNRKRTPDTYILMLRVQGSHMDSLYIVVSIALRLG